MRIIAVSAGIISPVKESTNECIYLNYGLLGLVTGIKSQQPNWDVQMFQADTKAPMELINLIGYDRLMSSDYILLGCTSFLCLSWTERFTQLINMHKGKLIVGGRYVVDGNKDWLDGILTGVDFYSEGYGEYSLYKYLGLSYISNPETFQHFDYTLLNNYWEYNPSIEISRGCGRGCKFCTDAKMPRVMNKPVSTIATELNELDILFRENYTVYLEAPNFLCSTEYASELSDMLIRRKYHPKWRCTLRIDTFNDNVVEPLSKTNLRVVDIGLESASPTQLLRMGKCKDSEKYLMQAEHILDVCNDLDIWVKFNVLLYAGETNQTYQETLSWLLEHSSKIKGISTSILTWYRGDDITAYEKLGATFPDNSETVRYGYSEMNLSDEIDLETAHKLAIDMKNRIQTNDDYNDIKLVGYRARTSEKHFRSENQTVI